jgi:hypothetical protein
MVKAKISITPPPAPGRKRPRRAETTPTSDSSLLLLRLKELDREFARQTRQLTALTKKLGRKFSRINPD